MYAWDQKYIFQEICKSLPIWVDGKSFYQNIPHLGFFSAFPNPGLASFYVKLYFPKMHTFVKHFMVLFIWLEYLSQNES